MYLSLDPAVSCYSDMCCKNDAPEIPRRASKSTEPSLPTSSPVTLEQIRVVAIPNFHCQKEPSMRTAPDMPRGQDTLVMQILIPAPLKKTLRQKALSDNLSQSAVVRIALRKFLETE